MKLTFETNPLTLPEARVLAEQVLESIKAGQRRLDVLQVADLCAHVLEPRRRVEKPKEENGGEEQT